MNKPLYDFFEDIDNNDFRIDRTKLYPLSEIIFLVLCATIVGVIGFRTIEIFGNERIELLRKYLPYINGIPNHQTISRVLSIFKPKDFTNAFIKLISITLHCSEEEIIALDGKALRRSFDKCTDQKAMHILNAWAVNTGICLGHLEVDCKTNEIKAVPELLDMIDIKNSTITVDALNTQKDIAKKIIEKEANYALALKGNHKNMQTAVIKAFDDINTIDLNDTNYLEVTEKGHGRIENRNYTILPSATIQQANEWRGLLSIGKTVNTVFHVTTQKETTETRYFLLSFDSVKHFAESVRGHWGIENKLHWVLDVTFREDDSRIRKDHTPTNMSLIRKMAINLLRQDKTTKLSVRQKQAKAMLSAESLDNILNFSKTT